MSDTHGGAGGSKAGRNLALLLAGLAVTVPFTFCCCVPLMFAPDQQEVARMNAEADMRRAAERAAAAEARRELWESLPATQRAFCESLERYRALYEQTEGDLARSRLRNQRGPELRDAVPGGVAQDWVGTVETLTTTSAGNVVLVLDLPCEGFSVGTTNNELSAVLGAPLISRDSPLYDTLAELSVGDGLRFSGRLLPDDRDGWQLSALTERGSMTAAQFYMRF